MSADEKARIGKALTSIENTTWWPAHYFELWLVEHRMASERAATARLTFATWALVASTAVLAFATVALVIATVAHHG
jgi:hypothetical protein